MDGKSALSHLWPGAPLAFASAALFGLTAPLSKILLAASDPQLLAGALYLGAGIGLASVSSGAAREEWPPPRRRCAAPICPGLP